MAVTINGSTGITTNGISDTTGTDALNNVTVAGTLAVTGATTLTGAVSQTGSSTAASFIPTGSTVPANGVFLPSANTVAIATNSTNQVSISSTGIVTGTAGNLMLVQGSSQPSTSGTSITFTGIPSWAKRITVMFNGVSTGGTSSYIIRIGSGSVISTGYNCFAINTNTGSLAGAVVTTGMPVINAAIASAAYSGVATICNISGNTWVYSAQIGSSISALGLGAGSSPALSGALDRVVITTVSGDTFNAGSINIQYE
jgi:hypothetical protein